MKIVVAIFAVFFLNLFLDFYVVNRILTRAGNPNKKLLWLIVVLLLPIIGPFLYLLVGGRPGNA